MTIRDRRTGGRAGTAARGADRADRDTAADRETAAERDATAAERDTAADRDTAAARDTSAERDADRDEAEHPEGPTDLSRRTWWGVLKRTVKEFQRDNLTDWAAALTYYGVLSIFPALLAFVSVLGLLGDEATESLLEEVSNLAPGPGKEILSNGLTSLQESQGAAGVMLIVGLATALWAASGYVAAFVRAANAIYDVPEGRPFWKLIPLRLAITVVVGILLLVSLLAVVLTGSAAQWAGDLIGAGEVAVTVWDIAKWPVLLAVVSLVFALLYWAAPNASVGGFRWITPGGVVAVLLWIIASAGFGFYVANFASYNRTYGAFATPIIFLVWLWISNIAVLLGAEFDAELHRGKAIEQGHPPGKEPYLELRDTRKVTKGETSGLG